MKFLKASQWVHKKNEFFLEFREFTEHLPCVTDSAHTCIHFSLLDNAVR